jgi:hypothetical protein
LALAAPIHIEISATKNVAYAAASKRVAEVGVKKVIASVPTRGRTVSVDKV